MITLLAKHSRWMMIVIAILAIPFIFYFNKADLGARRNDSHGRLYGHVVSAVEFDRAARMFELARDLGMVEFWQEMVGMAQSLQQAQEQFAINLLVLRHEAAQLGIEPTAADAAKELSSLPVFRGQNGGFDMKKYTDAVQSLLGPLGFTETQMEELAGAEVSLKRIKELLGAGAVLPESESKKNFEELYSKYEIAVLRLNNSDVANELKISDDDISKYYDAHKAELKSDEKRRVQFVTLLLNEQEKKLTGHERIEALQKLSDRATDVSQALAQKGADFGAVAAKFQLPVTTTGEFTSSTPDPQLAKDPQLTEAAFALTKEDPTSEPLQGADGFYILHLTDVVPAQPLSLAEAKPKIVDAIKASRTRELLSARATKVVQDLRDALKNGETVAAACQKLKLKPESVPPFTLSDQLEQKPEKNDALPDLPLIKRAVANLQVNEVTEPLPLNNGMLIAVVEKKEAPGPADASKRAALDERVSNGKRNVLFAEWLRERRHAAGVVEVAPSDAS